MQEAQWVAHIRRTLKEAVTETLQERPRPEKPSLRVVEHLQQMLFTASDGTTKEAASGLEMDVRMVKEENRRLTQALANAEAQFEAEREAGRKLRIEQVGIAPKVVEGLESRTAAHAAHAAHVVQHATAELKHELAAARSRIVELESLVERRTLLTWQGVASASASAPEHDPWTARGLRGWLLCIAPELSDVIAGALEASDSASGSSFGPEELASFRSLSQVSQGR